jgi:hypothetical protein
MTWWLIDWLTEWLNWADYAVYDRSIPKCMRTRNYVFSRYGLKCDPHHEKHYFVICNRATQQRRFFSQITWYLFWTVARTCCVLVLYPCWAHHSLSDCDSMLLVGVQNHRLRWTTVSVTLTPPVTLTWNSGDRRLLCSAEEGVFQTKRCRYATWCQQELGHWGGGHRHSLSPE